MRLRSPAAKQQRPMKRSSACSSATFFERYAYAIVIVSILMLPLIFMGARRAIRSNRNDVREWLPSDFPQTAVHRWFRQHFPHEQFVLISWDGCTLDDPRLGRMVERLRDFAAERNLAAQEEISGLKSLTSQAVSRGGSKKATGAGEPVFFKSVFSGQTLVEQFRQRYPNMPEVEILRRFEGTLIGPDHRTTCVVATLIHELHGPELKEMVATLHRVAQEVGIEPPEPPDTRTWFARMLGHLWGFVYEIGTGKRWEAPRVLHLGGPPIDNHAIDTEGQRTLYRLAALSALVGLGVSIACLRSVRLTLIVFSLAVVAAGLGLSIVYFTGRSVDAVMLSMPSLVYVLAISASIHLVNYYHDAVRTRGLRGACEEAVRHGFRPCFLAALTTAFGLGSLALSHVTPISKFGIYSAIGVMATLVLTFLVLPALLQIFPSRQLAHKARGGPGTFEESPIDQWWRWAGGKILRYRMPIAIICTGLMVWGALGLARIRTSVKLMKFFSPDAPIVQDYTWLEQHLGPLVPMEIILRVDNSRCKLSLVDRMRLVQRIEEVTESLPPVGGVLSAATFAPELTPDLSAASAFERVLGINRRRVRDDVLSKRLESHREAFRDYLTYEGDAPIGVLALPPEMLSRLSAAGFHSLAALREFAGRQPLADRLVESLAWSRADAKVVEEAVRQWYAAHGVELWRISARVEALSDLDYGQFVDDLRAAVEPVLAQYRAEGVEGIEAIYTGLVPLVYQVQHELFRSLFYSLMMAFVLIAGVMIILLRSVWGGLVAMLPNIFPAVVVFGAMGWGGILVDVGTMMTASVALGVAVDDTIHFLTWFRDGLRQGLSRANAVRFAYGRCARAMTQTSLVAGLGLAVFALSAFTPTQRFGSLMLILLGTALVGDLVYYPALLTGPLGANFARRGTGASANGACQAAKEKDQNGRLSRLPVAEEPVSASQASKVPAEIPAPESARSAPHPSAIGFLTGAHWGKLCKQVLEVAHLAGKRG